MIWVAVSTTSCSILIGSLQGLCPPREVRNFRVLVVQDACTRRRPANRTAQVTVWDVLSLSLSEGAAAGSFEVGQRYLVSPILRLTILKVV